MPKRLSFQLTEEGLREIVKAIKHEKRPEVRQRAMGLRLLYEGKPHTIEHNVNDGQNGFENGKNCYFLAVIGCKIRVGH